MKLPELGQPLNDEQLAFLRAFAKSCRRSIITMVTNAQSGHPGGSLSSVDYLALIYAMRVCQSNERVVVSNGHISPAVYAVLAELGVIPKDRVLQSFRKPDDLYEGHVNRKIQGVHYGTGPLGIGGSVANGLALGDVIHKEDRLTFLLMGDGEQQEGQAYEMMNFAAKYALKRLVLFIDYNEVQLTDSLACIMPTNIAGHYAASGWQVLEVDGHDFQAMWRALGSAAKSETPTLILGKTFMGKGVSFMEETGLRHEATWHGKAPKKEDAEAALTRLELDADESRILEEGLSQLPKNIRTPHTAEEDLKTPVLPGEPFINTPEVQTDCRGAYGKALADLAKNNPHIVALTADVAGSVRTDLLQKEFPDRHFECGISEQHMVSVSGGLSLQGFVPFCSVFGAFMTSRAKDQARVNDINETNVKMVATHCGLSVGEDGPTHQAIDDISSFAGFFHTKIYEPADPNQCDHLIRFAASHYGNVYVRMGRSKASILTKTDGTPFFDKDYRFNEKIDVLREGSKLTLVAAGPMVTVALKAAEFLGGDIEVLAVSSFIPFDAETLLKSVKKTGRLVSIHDHHVDTGLAHFVNKALLGTEVKMKHLGVSHYSLSGTVEQLYEKMGLTAEALAEAAKSLL